MRFQGLQRLGGIRILLQKLQFLRVLGSTQSCTEQYISSTSLPANNATSVLPQFIAMASHDLRQPMHAQSLFLNMLGRTELTPEQLEIVENLNAVTQSASAMLDALIKFSSIEAGVVKPQVRSFRIQSLFNKLEREFAHQASEQGITYRTHETGLTLHSDPALLELILRNLISNALRFTDNGGMLLATRKRGNHAVLEIWDTGCGISTAQQQTIFQDYKRQDEPNRDARKGLGLGLAIADGLARLLGGELSLASSPLRGSVFRLSIPIADKALAPEEAQAVQATAQSFNVRVLLIEDDPSMRAYMNDLLHYFGCQCDAANSVAHALALAVSQAPDLLISDYRLNEPLNGIEAITALRAVVGHNLPAMLITGDTTPDLIKEAQNNNIYILQKPLSASELQLGLMKMLQTIR
jgi:two-component system, sensor histidine kinase